MAKFCTKCGSTLEENASFCTTCGAKFENTNAQVITDNADESILDKFKANANADGIKKLTANDNFKKYLGIGVVGVVALILIILLCSLLTGGYKKPLDKYFDAIEDKDGALLMECYSEYEIDAYKKDNDLSKKEAEKSFKSSAKYLYEYYKDDYGRDFKIKYSVEDKEKLEDGDLKDIEEILQIEFDKKKLEVTKGYILDLEVEFKGDDDEDTEDMEILVLKIDGEWCMTMVLDADDDYDDILKKLEERESDD